MKKSHKKKYETFKVYEINKLKDKYSDLFEYWGKPVYILKICLIGSPAVGKTCIARRACFNTFDGGTKLTIGIDFYTYDIPIIVKGEKNFVRLTIWEFGGQEQFKKLFPYYINGAKGIFLVFDLANIETLTKLDWWYDRFIECHQVDCPKMLIGTKLDLIDEKSTQFKIDELIVKEFIKNHDKIDFVRTSAKENINIRDCIKEMAKKILEHNNLNYEKLIMKNCIKCGFILPANSIATLIDKERVYCPNCGKLNLYTNSIYIHDSRGYKKIE